MKSDKISENIFTGIFYTPLPLFVNFISSKLSYFKICQSKLTFCKVRRYTNDFDRLMLSLGTVIFNSFVLLSVKYSSLIPTTCGLPVEEAKN